MPKIRNKTTPFPSTYKVWESKVVLFLFGSIMQNLLQYSQCPHSVHKKYMFENQIGPYLKAKRFNDKKYDFAFCKFEGWRKQSGLIFPFWAIFQKLWKNNKYHTMV